MGAQKCRIVGKSQSVLYYDQPHYLHPQPYKCAPLPNAFLTENVRAVRHRALLGDGAGTVRDTAVLRVSRGRHDAVRRGVGHARGARRGSAVPPPSHNSPDRNSELTEIYLYVFEIGPAQLCGGVGTRRW
jgi:hypothetical protein